MALITCRLTAKDQDQLWNLENGTMLAFTLGANDLHVFHTLIGQHSKLCVLMLQ